MDFLVYFVKTRGTLWKGNNNKGKILNQDRFEMAMNVRIKQEIKENSM